VDVVVLAGGRGTRLAPFTTVLPKPLMPLGEEPILAVLLRQLGLQGFPRVTLAIGYLGDLIRAYCGDGDRHGVSIDYLTEETPLGTVGPLAFLPPADPQRLLVMNGDVLTTLRFGDMLREHERSGAIATIAVQRRAIGIEFGVLDLGEPTGGTRRITGYREKPEVEAMVSMGVYAFEREALDYIDRGERLDLPDLVLRLLGDGRQVAAFPFDGYWLDIGRHTDYQQALDEFAEIRPHLLASAADSTHVAA
jgi:NDP-sugar pyrophosphorylase family protein